MKKKNFLLAIGENIIWVIIKENIKNDKIF